jgi:hypothetical protein
MIMKATLLTAFYEDSAVLKLAADITAKWSALLLHIQVLNASLNVDTNYPG